MTEDELLALVEHEEANCVSAQSGTLAEQRRQALQYYYGQPYGNEVEGRSQVVTTEVKDAIEGILPSLMAIFTSSDEIVRFEPQNMDDEPTAQQVTDTVNYVFSRLNNGFLALYCLFKDALLQKNGYLKVYWEDYTDQKRETYENLTDVEFESLINDPELELIEHSSREDEEALPAIHAQQEQMAMMGMQMEIPIPQLHDAVFKRTQKYGKVCIDPVPPEEVLVSRETPNELEKARFVEHKTRKTISQVREMGYDIPDDIADYSPNADFNLERVERNKFDDADAYKRDASGDPTTREVWLCEAYLHVDYDGDGIAEFRKITKVGKTVLDNVEFDGLPIIGGTAIVMPHKHYGLSLHDLVGDIQLIKSTITRQLLDNAYVANNGRMAVLDGMVNMDDLLTSRPNGIVRTKTLNALQRIDQPLLGAPFYNLLEYFDKVKQNRVGATDFPNAVDPDAINAKAAFVDAFRNAAMERVNLMARILAEGPVKSLFWKIFELLCKHQRKQMTIQLRGKWIPVDPREWRNRFDMTVTVGLGTGSQQTTLNGAMGILQIQAGAIKSGLAGRVVTEANVYQAARRYAKAVFPKDADAFFTDPNTLPPPEPQPNPDLIKLQLQKEKQDTAAMLKETKMQMDAALEERQRQFEAAKEKFTATVQTIESTKDRQLEVQQLLMERDMEAGKRLADMVKDLESQKIDAQKEAMGIAMQGVVDMLAQMREQQHQRDMQMMEHMQALREAAMAEKEIVRDEKGKAKGVRPKKAA